MLPFSRALSYRCGNIIFQTTTTPSTDAAEWEKGYYTFPNVRDTDKGRTLRPKNVLFVSCLLPRERERGG